MSIDLDVKKWWIATSFKCKKARIMYSYEELDVEISRNGHNKEVLLCMKDLYHTIKTYRKLGYNPEKPVYKLLNSYSDYIVDRLYTYCIILYDYRIVMKFIEEYTDHEDFKKLLVNVRNNDEKNAIMNYLENNWKFNDKEFMYINKVAMDIYNIKQRCDIEEKEYNDDVCSEYSDPEYTELDSEYNRFYEDIGFALRPSSSKSSLKWRMFKKYKPFGCKISCKN